MAKSVDSPTAASNIDPSLKRKKDKPDDIVDNGVKKKARSRVSYSCGECHRRKQKCDRQAPCSHCVARKVPELCKPYTPGRTDQDIHARIARLEHIVEVALPQFANQAFSSPHFPGPRGNGSQHLADSYSDDDRGSPIEEQDLGGTFQSGKWYGNSATGSVAATAVIRELSHVTPTGQSHGFTFHDGSAFTPPLSGPSNAARQHPVNSEPGIASLLVSVQDLEPSAADIMHSLVQDCGVSPTRIPELIQELPPPALCDVLIDHYFLTVNWTRYPIYEAGFRASYQSIKESGMTPNPNDIRFLPLLFVVLAIAVRLAPERIIGDSNTRRISSLRYYWSSRRALLLAAAIQPDTLEMILVRLLSARFMTFDRRITECWSQLGAAVRTAQALGLHRDVDGAGMDPIEVEYRRRIWAYLYIADRSYALVLGRPTAIHDDHISTLPPMNITDLGTVSSISPGPPLTSPSRMAVIILRQSLAVIIGRVVNHFQQVRVHSHYSEVLALDEELQRFMDSLPPHYSLHPDTSLDTTETYIPMHRFLLLTEILYGRISLHRPYLLRRLDTDRYAASRRICFALAILDFEVRQKFSQGMPQEVREATKNAYREFQTAMVSGIYLVLEPNGKDATAMHAILDAFLSRHEGAKELDQTTSRELKIIKFLKSKASLMMENNGGRPPGHDDSSSTEAQNHNDQSRDVQANLLLSLQHSRQASSSTGLAHGGSMTNGVVQSLISHQSGQTSSVRSYLPMTPIDPASSLNSSSPPVNHGGLSPTLHRLLTSGSQQYLQSGSASPAGEDDQSAAQSLLDHWYSTMSNEAIVDGFAVGSAAFMQGQGQWNMGGGGAAAVNPGAAPTWQNAGVPFLTGTDPHVMHGVEGSDWNIWENLVSQIRGVPMS